MGTVAFSREMADPCGTVSETVQCGTQENRPVWVTTPMCNLPTSGLGWQGNHLDSSFSYMHVQLPTRPSKTQLLELATKLLLYLFSLPKNHLLILSIGGAGWKKREEEGVGAGINTEACKAWHVLHHEHPTSWFPEDLLKLRFP